MFAKSPLLLVWVHVVHFLECTPLQVVTLSAFGGKGKLSALRLGQKNKKYQEAFSQVGEEQSLSEKILKVLEEFACRLYATSSPNVCVKDMRFKLFRAKKGDVEPGQLPPCKDCLNLHCHCATCIYTIGDMF